MIELTIFEAVLAVGIIVSLSTFVIVPLSIRYGIPDSKEN